MNIAELRFANGTPPAVRLCGSFASRRYESERQDGSATATSGPIAYLFSLVNEHNGNGAGGGYYWIGGAVDETVQSVTYSIPGIKFEPKYAPKFTLVTLSDGWRGFATEYSPPPFPTPPITITFTAFDRSGKPIDSRYIDLDTNAQHKVPTPANITAPTSLAFPTRSTSLIRTH